jgi:diguanylate cyclase (GGDEF)-like protein/PAS domain S-box-containing protein
MVRTFSDVTNYVQAEAARQQLNQLLDITQSMARVGGLEVDVVNDRLFWTAGTYRILETSPQEFTPTTQASARHFYAPESLTLIRSIYSDKQAQPRSHDIEIEMITAKGRHIWVHAIGTAVWDEDRLIKRIGVIQDISERKQAQALTRENEQRWKLALEGAGDGMWDWNIQSGEEFYSKNLLAMYGFTEAEIGSHAYEFDERTHPDDRAQLRKDRQAHFDGLTATYTNEHRMRCKDGSWKWVLSRGTVISRDPQGQPLRMIGTHTDITSRKAAEAQIWQQAHFDPLTQLPNRRMLRDRLAQEIKQSRRDGQQFALLFIDLDHFKEVNDTLGHDRGDLLLIEAARRLRASVRECDTVARMGGDEFTIILTQLADVAALEPVLQKLLQTMERVFQLEDEQVFVTASIGVTMHPADGSEVEDLFKNADQALYVAKGAGRNRYSFFTPALQAAAQTRVRLANDLRSGLNEAQFWLAYQPIVELISGAVHKAEALIRWQHPIRGLVSPVDFIPIAEASGLIVDIGEWVFRQAAAQVQRWRAALDPRFQISINRSPVQFQQRLKVDQPWTQKLQALGLPGNSLVMEITEGLLLDSSDAVAEQLMDLQDAGIGVSLDDFGTGYSSLSYLQKFSIDFIKIDQSFVRHLIPGSTDLALCKAIILMAHELGMKVIAEGVETALQRDLLLAAGCDYGQGYLFARPMPAHEFEAFMAAHPSRLA